jgi:hypothetical protein
LIINEIKGVAICFGDKKINCVTKDDLNQLSNRLSERGLATGTINQILLTCQTPLKWCYKFDCQVLLTGLQKTLRKLGIDYKGRNISFHSWRHFFCSQSTQKISGEKVAKFSGHLSEAVFKKYADHIESENVRNLAIIARFVLFMRILTKMNLSDAGILIPTLRNTRKAAIVTAR